MKINYAGMDPECVALVKAINRIDGIETTESCCGHGKYKFLIFLDVEKLENLPILLYFLSPCHGGFNWSCKVKTDCGMSAPTFFLESNSMGDPAYKEANETARLINNYFEGEKAIKGA